MSEIAPLLGLKDFFHLPQVDSLLGQLAASPAGLVIVAGYDPPAAPEHLPRFLPSGRTTLFRILAHQIMADRSPRKTQPGARRGVNRPAVEDVDGVTDSPQAIVVAESWETIRSIRQLGRARRAERQVEGLLVKPPYTYQGRIADATRRKPAVLVIDNLNVGNVTAALEAARQGVLVLSQLNTVFSGAGVIYALQDWDVPRELLDGLGGIVTVQHMPTLCSQCKQPEGLDATCQAEALRRYPALADAWPPEGVFFRPGGCAECQHTGWRGNVMAFDIFLAGAQPAALLTQPSQLSLEDYSLHLAGLGVIPLGDVIAFDGLQLRRIYRLLTANEQALAESDATLERKLAQLEAANQVLEHRTEALVSLQGVSQTLATLTDVDELSDRVCRYTRDLCGAERVILYFLRPDGTSEIRAAHGWGVDLLHHRLDTAMVMNAGGVTSAVAEPTSFATRPPGVLSSHLVGSPALLSGLRVPLIAQQEVVGLMIVHTARPTGFAPGEVAMLQAFANQAAVALQRAGLIDALRDKIIQLEAAHAELVEKEFIKDTFGKLVDPRVRDHLLSGNIELGGALKQATVLFVDIRGFTPMSEKMRPDQVVAVLNRYFERMSTCIVEEGGLINRYIGDAIMAVFGVPLSMPDHADAAVRAALKMRAARHILNKELEAEGQPPIHTGTGIHTGPVLAGNIGSSSRMEYTVIGDTVNLAARTEKLCKEFARDLIFSEVTAQALSQTFNPVYLDTVKVQGKEQPIRLFYV